MCVLYYVLLYIIYRHCVVGLLDTLLQAYRVTMYETVTLKSMCAHIPRISIIHKYNRELEKT